MNTNWRDYGVDHLVNPDQATLRAMALENTPCILETSYGNLNKVARNKARQAAHTYIITDETSGYSHKTIPVAEAQALIDAQAEYIKAAGRLIEVQGYIGVGPRAVAVQYLYTIEGSNIAGMQQILSFSRERVEADPTGEFPAKLRVVYTPDFRPNVPGSQRILVDLKNNVTYVMGPDYFGESKKGALRMFCADAFNDGGLVMHAGAKEVHMNGDKMTVVILGLSGTGKTTTTFSKQGDGVQPVQDDMVAIWPNGELSVTENGCFAKTFGLAENTEPVIYRGSIAPSSWLENTYQDGEGGVDFFKTGLSPEEVAVHRDILVQTGANAANVDKYIAGDVKFEDIVDAYGTPEDGWDFVVWTGNGRSIIPLSAIDDAADLDNVAPFRSMGILNRDEGDGAITPGIVRFTSPEQAAGYFMLGETTKTSAAGKERGKIRSPFTQPFFPLEHTNQATRFSELLATTSGITTWMMNTGFVAGDSLGVDAGTAFKVKIRHSSAMLNHLFQGDIVWTRDPDFGYDVVDLDAPENAALLEAVPVAILRPDVHYKQNGRQEEYAAEVAQRHADRKAFLAHFSVDPAIITAVVGA